MSCILRPASPINDDRLYPAYFVAAPILSDTIVAIEDKLAERGLFKSLEDSIVRTEDTIIQQHISKVADSFSILDVDNIIPNKVKSFVILDNLVTISDDRVLGVYRVYGDGVYTEDELSEAVHRLISDSLVQISSEVVIGGVERVSVFAFTDIKNSIGFACTDIKNSTGFTSTDIKNSIGFVMSIKGN